VPTNIHFLKGLPPVTSALNDQSLDQIFRSARTPNGWADRPVGDDLVREIYDLLKWGPTSANSSSARFVWVRSPDGKATLAGLAAEPNKPKILKAPMTVIIGHDLDFADKLPKLLPHAAEVMQKYFAAPDVAEVTAMRTERCRALTSSSLRGRWDWTAGPCPASTTPASFFSGTRVRSNFICSIGHGDPASVFPRNPRLSFEEAGRWA
jgi:3-hydroxypropanoate dehydrogenase